MNKAVLIYLLFLLSIFNVAFANDGKDYFAEDFEHIKNISKPCLKQELADDFLLKNIKNVSKISLKNVKYNDEILNYINLSNLEQPRSNLRYDYSDFKKYNLKLRPKDYITTKNKRLNEGDEVSFVVANNLEYKDKIIKRGDIVKARIEHISQNQSFGVPANLKVGNLKYNNIPINGEIEVTGANRLYWVYPSYTIFMPFFGFGVFFAPIRGGHAKLRPTKEYVFEIN